MGWDYISELLPLTDILFIPHVMWVWRTMVEWYWQGKSKELGERTCPSATLSTTNPIWIYPGANPGRRSDRPATNRLNHGTTHYSPYCKVNRIVTKLIYWTTLWQWVGETWYIKKLQCKLECNYCGHTATPNVNEVTVYQLLLLLH
jgi:hypothetical protein